MSAPPYAAIAVYHFGEDTPKLLSVKNRVVIFDTAEIARNWIPKLGKGRPTHWLDADVVWWHIEPGEEINRAFICTDYDVYNVPPNHPVPSETRQMDWKHHIIWNEAFTLENT